MGERLIERSLIPAGDAEQETVLVLVADVGSSRAVNSDSSPGEISGLIRANSRSASNGFSSEAAGPGAGPPLTDRALSHPSASIR